MRDHIRPAPERRPGFAGAACHGSMLCALGLLTIVWGCGDAPLSCPDGSISVGGRCRGPDGGRADAATDSAVDGGPTDAAIVDASMTDAMGTTERDAAASEDACAGDEFACDGLDDDCDGIVDEGVLTTFFADGDDDGWGDSAVVCTECAASDCPGTGSWVTLEGDCDDANPDVRPVPDPSQPEEVCDGLDNDCDGVIDDGVAQTFYRDVDGDGFGTDAYSRMACSMPVGFVAEGGDCDDHDARVFPGQTMFFATPRSDESFDFNCDGTDTTELRTWGPADACDRDRCTSDARWQGEPVCGASGQTCSCLVAGLNCSGPLCRNATLRCR